MRFGIDVKRSSAPSDRWRPCGGTVHDRPAHTKDLLDSRSLAYYSLTLTIYDSCPVYGRFSIRPRAGYPQGAVGEKEIVRHALDAALDAELLLKIFNS